MADDQNVAVELAQLREQVKAIGENVSSIKATMSTIVTLEKTLAELAIYSRQTQNDVRLLWERAEESNAHQAALSRELSSVREEVRAEIEETDRKVEAWINQAKGAAWSSGIILGVVQVVVLSAVAWVFTNVTTLREQDTIQKIQIQRLEEQQRKETER